MFTVFHILNFFLTIAHPVFSQILFYWQTVLLIEVISLFNRKVQYIHANYVTQFHECTSAWQGLKWNYMLHIQHNGITSTLKSVSAFCQYYTRVQKRNLEVNHKPQYCIVKRNCKTPRPLLRSLLALIKIKQGLLPRTI